MIFIAKKKKRKPTLSLARKRLEKALETITNEQVVDMRNLFIDKFTLCDIACKTILEGYLKYENKYNPKKYVDLSMKQIPSAIALYGLEIERHTLNEIFGGSGQYKKQGTKSAKKLRDGIVHAMNENDVNEMVERYDELMNKMTLFLSLFEE
ncbi:MAG: hypothetical protein K6B52_03355 [Clostridiales bacterium]|nr:hypothetical protein [Clostridiales bacterium]